MDKTEKFIQRTWDFILLAFAGLFFLTIIVLLFTWLVSIIKGVWGAI